MRLLLFLLCITIICKQTSSSTSSSPSCHDNERTALLQFRLTFSIENSASSDPSAYPKTKSWMPVGNRSNCCIWDGVECDEESGNVTGLDLSSSYLSGSIRPNSTLFQLVNLKKLNLADNYFRYSVIPSEISRLTKLRYLNLSKSSFFGDVPIELSNLSMLVTLDLFSNVVSSTGTKLLKLHEPRLSSILDNLKGLVTLTLSHVSISSPVPKVLANITTLRSLSLQDCGLQGPMADDIFRLPQLQLLNLKDNQQLVSVLPEFHAPSKLEVLLLENAGFHGKIPPSIGNLTSLTEIILYNCNFQGSIPYTFGQLTKLTIIDFSSNVFEGSLPASLGNLTQLTYLGFGANNLVGRVPSSIANLTKLTALELSNNGFQGSIPAFVSGLENLQLLDLLDNDFQGSMGFDKFLEYKHLQVLQLSGVELILPRNSVAHNNSNYPQLVVLILNSCSLTRFPDILRNRTSLQILDLGMNNIQGPLIPLPNVVEYFMGNNELTGEIPAEICNATSLYSLILSYNSLSGEIPPCLFSFSSTLMVLSLDQNNLEGTIPDTFTSTCDLRVINLNNNRLQGRVPRSLARCELLAVIDMGSNRLDDTFPIWLQNLPNLQALALGSNNLQGGIVAKSTGFPSLQILDLSNNQLSGNLSGGLLRDRTAMEAGNQGQTGYLTVVVPVLLLGVEMEATYPFFITLSYKGRESPSTLILKIFTSIDLSNNRFKGSIPDSVGNLVGLQALNLSHNNITGSIPPSLGRLSNLESLDLSNNFLSADIPQQLEELTFLEIFNVSHNRLTGSIPQGNQFSTFTNDSFEGNIGLCGSPLSKKCGQTASSSSPPGESASDNDKDESSAVIDWIIRSMGYLSGLVIGVIFGHIFTTNKHEWFVETFGRKQRKKRKGNRKARRN